MQRAIAGESVIIPLPIGGMFSAGDPSTQPDGTVRSLRNYVFRPNRIDGRPPFVLDGGATTGGVTYGGSGTPCFFRWEDLVNGYSVTCAADLPSASGGKIYKKDASIIGVTRGFGWPASTAAASIPSNQIGLLDYTNFLGKAYLMFGLHTGELFTVKTAVSFDGTTISTTPFNSTIASRTITAYKDRLFLAAPSITTTPQLPAAGISYLYDLTGSTWSLTNITAVNVVANGITRCRLFLSSTTASSFTSFTAGTPNVGVASFAASATDRNVVYRADFHNNSATYDMPVTVEIVLVTNWKAATAYVAGDLITDGAGHKQRCTTAGTSGGVAPAWNATVAGTTADGAGTLVWTNEGSDILAASIDLIPNGTTQPGFSTYWVSANVPAATNTLTVSPRTKFFSTDIPTITLASIDVSLKDGVADGNLQKQNYGQQVTLGEFRYPFVNTETATSATVNLDQVIWSEIDEPRRILAKSNMTMPEVAGLATAATTASDRYIVFKRRGFWVFSITTDPDTPILPEIVNTDYGCLGPRSLDVFNNEVFFIGENGVYRMKVGEEPVEFGGDALREELMDRTSTTWVDGLGGGVFPHLVIDRKNLEVHVCVQKSKVHIFNLTTKQWSYIDSSAFTNVYSLFYDTIGRRMIYGISTTGGPGAVVALDELHNVGDQGGNETIDLIFKPIEAFAPERFELELEGVNLYHNATATQGKTLSLQYSLDRGSTWTTPAGYPVTVDITDPLIPLPIVQRGHSIMLRILQTAVNGGAATWSISKASARIKVISGEYYYVTATS